MLIYFAINVYIYILFFAKILQCLKANFMQKAEKEYIQFEVHRAKMRCTKTNTYPRAGHDGLSELWETICQAQYRPSLSSSNPYKLGVHSRCRHPF